MDVGEGLPRGLHVLKRLVRAVARVGRAGGLLVRVVLQAALLVRRLDRRELGGALDAEPLVVRLARQLLGARERDLVRAPVSSLVEPTAQLERLVAIVFRRRRPPPATPPVVTMRAVKIGRRS